MNELPDRALLNRLRDVVAERPVTEAELRGLIEEADGLVRVLGAHMAGSERRLTELSNDPESLLGEIAAELRRVTEFRLRLEDARALLAGLEERARAVRTEWLIRRTSSGMPPA